MSQYINLFNPALEKRHDPLSAHVLLAATVAALLVVAGATFWASRKAGELEHQAFLGEARLKQEQEKLVASAKGIAETKPDTKLADELVRAEAALKTRGDLVRLVEGGALGRTNGFSEQLRAFARQSMNGLWLTGFSIGSDGSELEIAGKAINAELLPAYIRRLNREQVFQGRSFAMLNVNRVEDNPLPGANAPQGMASAATGVRLPPHVEFSLQSRTRSVESRGRQ